MRDRQAALVMELRELYQHYPLLYHMAWSRSWTTIEKHGLLSTSALLDLYGIEDEQRVVIEAAHRPECITINKAGYPPAVIRDQKPMSDAGVIRALGGTIPPAQWYQLLNSMVFFWPTTERLKTMISAKAYRDLDHDVLVVRTEPLVKAHHDKLRLSPINSGCTKPFPHPRSGDLFKRFADYPFEERKAKGGVHKAIAEVCFVQGIPDIRDFVEDVVVLNASTIDQKLQ